MVIYQRPREYGNPLINGVGIICKYAILQQTNNQFLTEPIG